MESGRGTITRCKLRRLYLLIALAAVVAGCGSGAGDPAILEGVASIEVVRPPNDPPAFEIGVGSVEGDRTVIVEYNGGPICSTDRLAQEPGAVRVTYGSEITIELDPYTNGCGDVESAEYRAAIRIELEQAIDGREIGVVKSS